METGKLVGRKAEQLTEYHVGVLAKQGRGLPQAARRVGQVLDQSLVPDGPGQGMDEVAVERARGELPVHLDEVPPVPHRVGRRAAGLQLSGEFVRIGTGRERVQ